MPLGCATSAATLRALVGAGGDHHCPGGRHGRVTAVPVPRTSTSSIGMIAARSFARPAHVRRHTIEHGAARDHGCRAGARDRDLEPLPGRLAVHRSGTRRCGVRERIGATERASRAAGGERDRLVGDECLAAEVQRRPIVEPAVPEQVAQRDPDAPDARWRDVAECHGDARELIGESRVVEHSVSRQLSSGNRSMSTSNPTR